MAEESGVGEEHELSPDDLVEQIKRLKVSDVLLSTLSTVAQLGYAKLEPQHRDLEQARLAIESMRALTQVLEGVLPAEAVKDFSQVVANLQLAYAAAVAEEDRPAEAPSAPEAAE